MTFSEIGSERAGSFGIYIHWPFCKAKCPYCDFNSHVRHQPVNSAAYGQALKQELSWFRELTTGRQVSSIFFGGGTPSLLPPAIVADLLDHISQSWGVAADVEITLEANPTSVEADRFRGYRLAGVNRVSVGVQSLNEADLKALGRQHSPEEALAAFRLARKIFTRASFDMIYARPNQQIAAWREELRTALCEQNGHMSLYQLTIEPDTAYADLAARGSLIIPDEDRASDLYDLTQELTAAQGLSAYEVSNHAAEGQACRHNLTYWRYGDYIGVGPGAHGRLTLGLERQAFMMEKYPERWLQQVSAKGQGIVERQTISPQEQATEYLLMGLRLTEGIELARYERLGGQALNPAKRDELSQLGLIEQNATRLWTTARGRRLLDAVIREFSV